MPMLKKAFTMLELIFVIVVMGIIGSIGAEMFRSTYDAYMSSAINNRLQAETELALKQIANRLQYRLKDSVIARTSATNFDGLSSATGVYPVIEWVGYDIDGLQGQWNAAAGFHRPTWSGFIDVDDFVPANPYLGPLSSPGTDTGEVNTTITNVRANGSGTTIADAAIFFTGANTNVQTGYGWNGTALTDQNGTAAHRISVDAGNVAAFRSGNADNFANVDIYEQYKLAWTAYALRLEDNGDLNLYYDYQPWAGEDYNTTGTEVLLMENVTTFKFQAIGDIIKFQLCVDNNSTGTIPANQLYSLCKEKVIF